MITEVKALFIDGNDKCSNCDFYYFVKIKMKNSVELLDGEKVILQKRLGKDYIKKSTFISFLSEHGIDFDNIFQKNFQEELK